MTESAGWEMSCRNTDRIGWIIAAGLLVVLLVLGLLWVFGVFKRPPLPVALPTPTIMPTPVPRVSPSLTVTVSTQTPTPTGQATPVPSETGVSPETQTPAPPLRQEPCGDVALTETPISLDHGVEAGFPP